MGGLLSPIQTLFDFPRFLDGLRVGVLLAVIVAIIGFATSARRRGQRVPWGLAGPAWVFGSLMCLGGWFGYQQIWALPQQLLVGLGILFVAGEIAERTPNPKVIGVVLGFPGALLVGWSEEFPGPSWSAWLVIGVAAIAGPLAADLDRRAARLGFGPVLWLITVGGLYGTVPASATLLTSRLISAACSFVTSSSPGGC